MGSKAFAKVLSEYEHPSRVYHGVGHIEDMFRKAAAWGLQLSLEQELAVLLHDVVYVPGAPAGANERASVQYLWSKRTSLFMLLAGLVVFETVAQIIMDTATHQPTCAESKPVLALDLSSLGSSWDEFAAANEAVWLENRHLLAGSVDPRAEFDARRLAFLQGMLARGPVFSVAFVHLERRMRANVADLAPETVIQPAFIGSKTEESK